ncbi:right-handed parallel beta-helix repeat-containing protein [Bacillus sp. FSL R9-9481]|uniref:right-handed parallel beta-helix repeat-containing protein n=1 Tax=Bacillus sp. FSL R9-9481 TaxID=2921591 RepID=UPI0030FAC3EC
MKTKLILDINKTQHAQLNSIVTGRVGDKASNTVDVYVVDGFIPYNLTGSDVYFECAKPDNTSVRDKNGITMIDAAKGHFEYTFPAQTFASVGKSKQAYFTVEKNSTVKATTQDFIIVSLPDALTNRIPSKTYISQLEELIWQLGQIELDLLNSEAYREAHDAKTFAEQAKLISESVQEQLNQIVINSSIDPETKQARVDKNGKTYETLKIRIDAEQNKIGILSGYKIYVESYPRLEAETDDTERIKRAVSDLNLLGGGELIFSGIPYRISDKINIYSNMTIKGVKGKTIINGTSIPIGTELSQRAAFDVLGSIGSNIPVTATVNQWSNIVTVSSTTGLKEGDLILITNNELYSPGTTATNWKKGELGIVKSVDSATQITLKDNLIYSYDSTQSTKIQRIAASENITFMGINLKMGGVGSVHNGLKLKYARNITVKDVSIDSAEDMAVNMDYVYNADIMDCMIENSTSPTPVGNTGYGVGLLNSRNIRIKNNLLRNCRHLIAGGGTTPTIYVDVVGNQGMNSIQYGFDCHEPCFYWTFKNNQVISCNGGIVIRGQYCTVDGNEIIGSNAKGILVQSYTPVNEQYGTIIRNNRIKKTTEQGIYVDGNNCLQRDVTINGNVIEDVLWAGIHAFNFKSIKVNDNVIINGKDRGIYIGGKNSSDISYDAQINGNKIRDTKLTAVCIKYVEDVTISASRIDRSLEYGVQLDSCTNTNINGGVVKSNNFYGIYITAGSRHVINGVTVLDCTDVNGDGIRANGTSDVTIANNVVKGNPRFGIYITTTNYVIITGNNARNNTNATKISVDSSATSLVNANNLV